MGWFISSTRDGSHDGWPLSCGTWFLTSPSVLGTESSFPPRNSQSKRVYSRARSIRPFCLISSWVICQDYLTLMNPMVPVFWLMPMMWWYMCQGTEWNRFRIDWIQRWIALTDITRPGTSAWIHKKCETILFKKPVNSLTSKTKAGSTRFQISATIPGTCNKELIPHRKVVKYLGVHLDYLLRGNKHLDIQLEKANKAFLIHSRMFYNKFLSKKAKLILYMLLVRPIITYAAPVIWNYNHTSMERVRILERKCLRACLRLYRTPDSDWQHYVKNQTLYDTANITRIDSFLISLTRDYFSKLTEIDNPIIQSLAFQDVRITINQLSTGYLSPQAFPFCDHLGLIQDAANIPLIYHWRRNKADKRIAFSPDDFYDRRDRFKFSMAIPKLDSLNFKRLNFEKFWWLSADSTHILELADRRAFTSGNRTWFFLITPRLISINLLWSLIVPTGSDRTYIVYISLLR